MSEGGQPGVVEVGEIIRIVDPEIDVDAIMAEIRANLGRRTPLDPDPSRLVYRPGEAALLSAEAELEWELEQAVDAQRDLGVSDQLRPGVGLIGQLATRAKAPLHQLARFYVDLAVQKQAALQGHVVRSLRLLAQQAAARQEETARLRAEVAELRQELAALRGEGKVTAPVYFVVPWYPERTFGGAESLARYTVEALRQRGVDARVLTTCVPDFRSDWGQNALPRGAAVVGGAPVERFPVDRRDWRLFDQVNLRLMRGEPVTEPEARVYVEENIRSRALEERLSQLEPDATCVYMPYLHGTTYWGLQARPGWLWSCLHDEPYARLPPFGQAFARAEGVLCNTRPEAELVRRLFPVPEAAVQAVGVGVETAIAGDAARFRATHGVDGPFLLYVGRHDHGKNLDGLLADVGRYRAAGGRMRFVRVGAGQLPVPRAMRGAVVDLGILPEQDKLDAVAAATVLCVPGVNESFSIVLMEGWLLGTPGLVNADCAVTSDHVRAAAGGLTYRTADELGACLDWLLDHPEAAARMGQNGGAYVRRNFDWNVVVARLRRALAV